MKLPVRTVGRVPGQQKRVVVEDRVIDASVSKECGEARVPDPFGNPGPAWLLIKMGLEIVGEQRYLSCRVLGWDRGEYWFIEPAAHPLDLIAGLGQSFEYVWSMALEPFQE